LAHSLQYVKKPDLREAFLLKKTGSSGKFFPHTEHTCHLSGGVSMSRRSRFATSAILLGISLFIIVER